MTTTVLLAGRSGKEEFKPKFTSSSGLAVTEVGVQSNTNKETKIILLTIMIYYVFNCRVVIGRPRPKPLHPRRTTPPYVSHPP
jgi:hypothetical protein